MVAPRKEGLGKNSERDEGSDREDRSIGGESGDESMESASSSASSSSLRGRRNCGGGCGLAERLRDALRDGGDEDLLIDRSDVEKGVVQWLRALDQQVVGACRADERLMPLLKLNISSGLAEDRLMSQLSQHFEASEVGMLARCLCIPLVSIRVGKVNKHGNLLCPTMTRGHLNLTLLPSSNMRISFAGDDGCAEKLALLGTDFESPEADIEEIEADSSGRTFLLRLPGSPVLYFWCSEKSKLHGKELLAKMKDILTRKPSLSQLTGISVSRLDAFATHLRAYLLGSSNTSEATSSASSSSSIITGCGLLVSDSNCHSPSMVSKSSRLRVTSSHTTKGHPSHQGSLSPRSNTFKDGTSRCSTSMRNGVKEKLRRRGDNSQYGLFSDIPPNSSVSTLGAQSSSKCENENIGENRSCGLVPICLPEMSYLVSSLTSSIPSPLSIPPPQLSVSSSLFSPYYCWCPPGPSSLQYTVTPSLPHTSDESLPLPPLSSLLSATGPPVSLGTSKLPVDVSEFPALKLPSLCPEPLVRLPLPVSPLVTLPSSQQIPTFTPYMSDPIVHIPVIDVCSSGQVYLVSAGPAISSAIPPLLPSLVHHPLIPGTESVVEKSARETLQMLMASAPASTAPTLMNVLPVVFKGMDENYPFSLANGGNHCAFATGGESLSNVTREVEAIVRGVSSMGFSPLKRKVGEVGSFERGNLERGNSGDPEVENHAVAEASFDCPEEKSLSPD